MWAFLHRFASPPHFYRLAGTIAPWLGWICLGLMAGGLYGGLVAAPPDYQQGDSYRIIFVHVPSAWMSMFIYVVMAGASTVALIWRIKLAEIVAIESAPVGASFTFLALVTGSLWGKPMWGTDWGWAPVRCGESRCGGRTGCGTRASPPSSSCYSCTSA